MSRFLIWDTSGPSCVVLTANQVGEVLQSSQSNYSLRHSEQLLDQINRVLKATSWTPAMVTHIGVGVGPGSFTGVRLGVLVANIWAHEMQVPIVPICSLEPHLVRLSPSGLHDQTLAIEVEACLGEVFRLEMKANDVAQGKPTFPSLQKVSKEASMPPKLSPLPDDLAKCFSARLSSGLLQPVGTPVHPHYLRETDAERRLTKH